MTTENGMGNSYSYTHLNERVVTDKIWQQKPYDIATYLALGANPGKFTFTRMGSTYEWLEKAYPAVTDVTDATLTSATNVTQFTPDDIGLYTPGMVLKIDSEYVWVSAVGASLTITRGYGGTTPATHANDSVINIIGMARLEGDDADNSSRLVQSTGYNYTQILEKKISISGTEQAIPHVGNYDPWADEVDGAMEYLMMLLNKLPYYGARAAGSTTTPRGAGGFNTFLSTNVTNLSDAALTQKAINTMIKSIHSYGGDPDIMLMDGTMKLKMNELYGDRFDPAPDNKFAGYRIDMIENPLGGRPLKLIVDRASPAGQIIFATSEKVGYVPLREFKQKPLADTGDSMNGEVVGEYGFVVSCEMHHGKLYGISTTK